MSRHTATALVLALALPAAAQDTLRDIQTAYVANKTRKVARAYHFGSQGPNSTFSNHASHTNRLIPVYTFGRKVDLASVTGKNSVYRDEARLRDLYGFAPTNTLNPTAEYCDQSDLYKVQKDAADRGAKYIITVWFDGMDWEATRAASIARTGKVYVEGKGTGLLFQDYDAAGSSQYGFYVTSPTHDKNNPNVDDQTVVIPADNTPGGYDVQIAGPFPWGGGSLDASGYLKGQNANAEDRKGVEKVGRVLHAYTDSAPSAAEYASGVKSYNNSINFDESGRPVPTIFQQLQGRGWRVGTATSVAFDHASPAAMYAHDVNRDDYQDLAREMLGLPGIVATTGKGPRLPGLDVVIGAGYSAAPIDAARARTQGRNEALNENLYITDADLKAINVDNGGNYVVSVRKPDARGPKQLADAAARAAAGRKRLFGFYGSGGGHLPYRTADGDYKPSPGFRGNRETYSREDLEENPTLADMARAALTVLSAEPGKPFALFVEAGDVDFALHDNNLDNAVGAIYSGEDAVRAVFEWVEKHSNWDEAVVIVTADHGHYLVLDDPAALK